ncbi:MAG: nodulation protein NfeD [Dehalococcoidia bacterium]
MRQVWRPLVLALSLLALAAGLAGVAAAHGREALFLEVDGIINPVSEGFIARGIQRGEEAGVELVIIRLDTPGGLLDSTRKIVEHLLESEVPTVVYVGPRGARAASAGTFITAAANFAVMAPGTNIGAASPVGGGGEELPETLADKVTNDAAALMRAIAEERGRNGEKLEETVRQATAFAAEEAVELNMVDFIAADVPDLLEQLDGRTATTPSGEVMLDTQDMEVRVMRLSLVERLLDFLSDPNVSFLLLSLGSLGLLVELLNPGLIAPGVVGVILLVLFFVTLGNLPVNWAGVALILIAVVLAFLEVQVAGFGVLGVGALVSFVLGALLLFFHFGAPSPTMPRIGVSLWVLVPTLAVLTVGGGWLLSTIIRSRRQEAAPTGISRLVGASGYVTTELAPRGTVQVVSEVWSAVSETGEPIQAGERVKVVRVDGLTLVVQRVESSPDPPSTEDASED